MSRSDADIGIDLDGASIEAGPISPPLMAALHLPKPKLLDIAVPANRNLGLPHGA